MIYYIIYIYIYYIMNIWKNSNLVKHNSRNSNKQNGSNPINNVNSNLNNNNNNNNNNNTNSISKTTSSQNLKQRAGGDTVTNPWKETKDVPDYIINEGLKPIYYDNGTVNIGSDQYLLPPLYSEIGKLNSSNESDTFGYSITCSDDGTRLAYSTLNKSVTIFTWDDPSNTWISDKTIKYSDLTSSISGFGDDNSSTYTTTTNNTNSNFGNSIKLSHDGNHLIIGAPGVQLKNNGSNVAGVGAVYVIDIENSVTTIIPPNNADYVNFGYSVYMYNNNFIAIGAPCFNESPSCNSYLKLYCNGSNGTSNASTELGNSNNAGGYCLDAYVQANSDGRINEYLLLVGSPNVDIITDGTNHINIGRVNVFYKNFTAGNTSANINLNLCDTSHTISDCASNINFGSSISIAREKVSDKIYAIVGGPNYSNEENVVVGKAYICTFDLTDNELQGEDIDIKFGIDNPNPSIKGCFGSSVTITPNFNAIGDTITSYSYFISNPSSNTEANTNTVSNGDTTMNNVYNYYQSIGNSSSQPTTAPIDGALGPIEFSGIPYNVSTYYGYGFSLCSSTRHDLVISDPELGIYVYNNRIQNALYVNGSLYIDGNDFGKTTMKNDIGSLQFGNIPSLNNSMIQIEGTSENPFTTMSMKSINTSDNSYDTLYSEQSYIIVDETDQNIDELENFKIGSVYNTDSNSDPYTQSYLAFNNEFTIYSYPSGSGFEWKSGETDPVLINSGNNDKATAYFNIDPVSNVTTITGDLDVKGSVSFRDATANTVGEHIVYDNSSNEITMELNQWFDTNVNATNADIFVVNRCPSTAADATDFSDTNKTNLFSINPYGSIKSHVKDSVVTNISLSDYVSPDTEYIKIAEFDTTTNDYGNIHIVGSLRNKDKMSPDYYIKTIFAVDPNTGEIYNGTGNNAAYQYVYVVNSNSTQTDGFVDINIKVNVNSDSSDTDIDMCGLFLGENIASKTAAAVNGTTTDIFVANDITSDKTMVYMRVAKDTISNLTIKYNGPIDAFVSGDQTTTDPNAGDYDIVCSLSGLGIVDTVSPENSTAIQAVTTDGSITGQVLISKSVRNNVMYNINGSLGLGLIPNTEIPSLTDIQYEIVPTGTAVSGTSTTTTSDYYRVKDTDVANFDPETIMYNYIRNNNYQNIDGDITSNLSLPLDPTTTNDANGKPLAEPNMFGPWMAPFRLDVSGNVMIRGILNTANLTTWSDRKIKKNIVTVDNALEKVNKLRGVYYENTKLQNKKCIGVIAQEIEEILPEVVNNHNDLKSVSYNDIIGVLIESIKELSLEVNELKSKINGK